MNLYKFQTYRTTYYFPDPVNGCEFLYGLYHPYNRFPLRLFAVKIYWWLFRHCGIFRSRKKVQEPDAEFPFSSIMQFCPEGSVVSFNMGTPGPEQKISMLGVDAEGARFFAKYSVSEAAKALSRNEIKVLKGLEKTDLTPLLLDYRDDKDFVFFRTSCVEGSNPSDVRLNDSIMNLLLRINRIEVKTNGLATCFSHGDFTPWNLIIKPNNTYCMIDWEMAGEKPLGFDLFTYITQVGAKLAPDQPLIKVIAEYKEYIERYFQSFGIVDWYPYKKAFAEYKIAYEREKGDYEYAAKFECLR